MLGDSERETSERRVEPTDQPVARAPSPVHEQRCTREFRQWQRDLPHWEDPGATYSWRVSTRPETAGLLTRPEIAEIVATSLHHDDNKRYELHVYVIMPDHFHAIIRPLPRGKGSSR